MARAVPPLNDFVESGTNLSLTPVNSWNIHQSGLTDIPAAPEVLFNWMTALGDLTRGRLLRLLERTELSVNELCSIVQSPQSTVSRHLKVLVDDGWVNSRRDGTSRLYHLAFPDDSHGRRELWSLLSRSLASSPHAPADDLREKQVLAERASKSQAFFASAAGQWTRMRTELFGKEFQLRFLPALMSPTSVVADLGCGDGELSEMLAPFAKQVVSIDSSTAMIETAKRRLEHIPNVQLQACPVERLSLANESCDLAVMILVMHYLTDPLSALKEVRRILKPGGRFVLVDIQSHSIEQYRTQMGHCWLGFSSQQLDQWLGNAGLTANTYIDLPPSPNAKGPPLFVASATR